MVGCLNIEPINSPLVRKPPAWSLEDSTYREPRLRGLRAEGAPIGRCHSGYDLRFPKFCLSGPIGREGRSV